MVEMECVNASDRGLKKGLPVNLSMWQDGDVEEKVQSMSGVKGQSGRRPSEVSGN